MSFATPCNARVSLIKNEANWNDEKVKQACLKPSGVGLKSLRALVQSLHKLIADYTDLTDAFTVMTDASINSEITNSVEVYTWITVVVGLFRQNDKKAFCEKLIGKLCAVPGKSVLPPYLEAKLRKAAE